MTVTVGTLLERIEKEPRRAFTFFMPGSNGPCRFGMYRQLHQIVLDRLGEGGRIGIWSPPDSDYFEGVPPGMGAIVLGGVTAIGMMEDIRDPSSRADAAGAADAIHARWSARLVELVERATGERPLREEGHARGGDRPRLRHPRPHGRVRARDARRRTRGPTRPSSSSARSTSARSRLERLGGRRAREAQPARADRAGGRVPPVLGPGAAPA